MNGEGQGDRKVMDGLIRDLRQAGVSGQKAEEKARQAMREADRRLRDQGKR